MSRDQFHIRPLTESDRSWVHSVICTEWEGETIVVRGEVYTPEKLPGLLAELDGHPVGLLTYRIHAHGCEVMTLNSWYERHGIGSALLEKVRQAALQAGCLRLHLVTTNNNLQAMHFYIKRGFSIASVRLKVLEISRKLKPGIPLVDEDKIPIHDEIELEFPL